MIAFIFILLLIICASFVFAIALHVHTWHTHKRNMTEATQFRQRQAVVDWNADVGGWNGRTSRCGHLAGDPSCDGCF